jgi:hypothetical protein
MPLRTAPVLVIALLTLVLSAAIAMRIPGILPGILAISWYFKYSFVVLDSAVEGKRELPALSADMINPVEQRPLRMLILLAAFYWLTVQLDPYIGEQFVTVIRYAALLLVPAMAATMSITGRFWGAINPVDVFGIILRMPVAYAVLLGIIALLWWVPLSVLASLDNAISTPLLIGIAMYLWLAMMTCIGGMMYEHRKELEFEPAESPERNAARQSAELERERKKIFDPIFAECRGGSFANAGKTVRALIDQSREPLTEFRWLYERASQWEDPRLAEYLAQYCLQRLLDSHATGEALTVVRARLRANPSFRPQSGAQLLRMVTLARDAGDKPTARALLRDFNHHFPNDAASVMVEKLTGELQT